GMRERDGLADRFEDGDELCEFAAGAEHVGEGAAADELHREERRAVRQFTKSVNRWNSGVWQAGRDLRLANEPPANVGGRVSWKDDLHGDFAIEGKIARREHSAHPAPRDLVLHFVTGNVRQT